MKAKKYIVSGLILILLLGFQLFPVLAENEGEEPVGPIVMDKIAIEYLQPTVGDYVSSINTTFGSNVTTLNIKSIDWANDNAGQSLAGDDAFEYNTKYLLKLGLSMTGAYVTDQTAVTLNGNAMTYVSSTAEGEDPCTTFSIEVKPEDMPAPAAVFQATGVDSGLLTNLEGNMEYSTDGGASWLQAMESAVKLEGISEGEIVVQYIADPVNKQRISITRQPAPTGISVKNCSTPANNDGVIAGVNSSMEYKNIDAANYTSCGDADITGLAPGKYLVRTKAEGTRLSSGDVQNEINKYSDKVPQIVEQPKAVVVETGKDSKYHIKADNADTYEWHVIDVQTKKDYVLTTKDDAKYYNGIGTDTLTVLSINKLKDGETDCKYSGDKYYCIVGNKIGTARSKIVDYTVKHVAVEGWKNDSTGHWQLCSCGAIMNKAEHQDKDEDKLCDVCDFEIVVTEDEEKTEEEQYTITNGANSTWQTGTTSALVISADAKIESFESLMVDDSVVAEDDYIVQQDSDKGTMISIEPTFLDTLGEGNHIVTMKFKDGSVSTQLIVAGRNTKNAEEAQESSMLWIILGIAAALLLMCVILLSSKMKKIKTSYDNGEDIGKHFRG